MEVFYIDASKCTECGSAKVGFNEKRSEFFCRDCGFVLMDSIPVIEATHGKIERVMVNPKEKKIAVVIRGILKDKTEKKMSVFYAEIKKFSLPKYIEAEVLVLAKKAVELKLTMSYSKLEILCALIYHLCRRESIPVMLRDLEKTYGCSKKRVLKSLKLLREKLALNEIIEAGVESYIIRISSDLGYNGELATKAISVAVGVNIAHVLLKAAVAVWIAGGELGLKIKKKELARVAGISEAALRKNLAGKAK
ncbi:MAG: hypothetical protein PHC66_01605 [Candidatus Nanoarchaeia archaeon]|nr:hypothetical protein [Candidatus Nanoarchaeia archaeon]MDD5239145.1 hypothetical protein [Candidatus Nanoarchaeia archaeon]